LCHRAVQVAAFFDLGGKEIRREKILSLPYDGVVEGTSCAVATLKTERAKILPMK
jgi:hypothetical protein